MNNLFIYTKNVVVIKILESCALKPLHQTVNGYWVFPNNAIPKEILDSIKVDQDTVFSDALYF